VLPPERQGAHRRSRSVISKAVGDYGSGNCGPDVCAFDRNLYWNASGRPVLFGNQTFAKWQASGQDQNSLIADPLFADPERGDFRLRPESPASRIGFKSWDLSKVGPRPSAPSAPGQNGRDGLPRAGLGAGDAGFAGN